MSEQLQSCSFDTVPPFALSECVAKVIDVYDADTVRIGTYVGDQIYQFVVRLEAIDSPEIRPRNSPHACLERAAARAARTRLIELCLGETNLPHEPRKKTRKRCGNSRALVRIVPRRMDKYGRVLATMYVDGDDRSVNDILLQEGYVHPYDGGSRSPWTAEDLSAIVALRADRH